MATNSVPKGIGDLLTLAEHAADGAGQHGAAMAGPATLSSLPPGATIRVRLTALNANGEGPPGPHAEITLPA